MLGDMNLYNHTTNLTSNQGNESPSQEEGASQDLKKRNFSVKLFQGRMSKSHVKNRRIVLTSDNYKTATCHVNPLKEFARMKQAQGVETSRGDRGPPKNETFA